MRFEKYVAAGNDFILFRQEDLKGLNYNKLAQRVCDRHFGIGADGILICENSSLAHVKMLYYNSDGSQGQMCGNGIRAFTKFIYDNDIVVKDRIKIETLAGVKEGEVFLNKDNQVDRVKINMGIPLFNPKDIPVNIEGQEVILQEIEIGGQNYKYSAVLVGVPHLVVFIDEDFKADINELGREIENHRLFPERINVNFIRVNSKENINIYTWERGAGRTLGCGTGSCAAVVIGNKLGLLSKSVRVNTEGGWLEVSLEDSIYMTGKASLIAKGDYKYA